MARKRKRPGTSEAATAETNAVAAADGEEEKASSRNSKKKSATTTGLWKKVDVGLLAPSKAAAGQVPETADEEFENGTYNHYDNPSSKIYRSAEKELEADPAEAAGIFFGLEVLDGSQYTVLEEEGGRKRIVTKDTATGEEESATDKNDANEQPRKKDNAKDKRKTDSKDTSESEEKEEPSSKKKKKKRKKKKKSTSDETEQDQTPEAKDSADSFDKDEAKESSKDEPKAEDSEEKCAANMKINPAKKKYAQSMRDVQDNTTVADDHADISALQTSWMTATGGVTLKDKLCKALLSQNFWTPTPIQAATLPAAILGRRNIVGAAPTGSGKTL